MFRSVSLEALVRRLTRRRSHSGSSCRSPRLRRITAALLGTCVSGWMASTGAAPALAKDDPEWTQWEEESPTGKPASGSATSTPTRAPRVEPAVDSSEYMGAIGRGGHLAAPTFGREESISPVEFMPFLMLEEHMFFGDARGFLTNRGEGGGNLGLGYRYLDNPAHAWYGASLWYDLDNSTGYHFQDVGISLEAMVERWEFRGNFYTPVGPQTKDLGSFNSNARFDGTQLLFDSTRYTGTAMRGFDVEAGYSLPVDLRGVNDQLRAFLGYYYFTGKAAPAFAQSADPFAVPGTPALAPAAPDPGAFTVSDIRVDGLQRISAGTVFTYLPIERGDTVGRNRIAEAIRVLYRTGFFEDVRIARQGNILVVIVDERPAINSLNLVGNKDIKTEDLTSKRHLRLFI